MEKNNEFDIVDFFATGTAKNLMKMRREEIRSYLETLHHDPNDEKLHNLYKISLEKEYFEICAEIKKILESRASV